MPILGCGDDAVERGQVRLELQPRLATTAGGVERVGVFQDEAFVAAVAGEAEAFVDVLCCVDLANRCREQGPEAFSNLANTLSPALSLCTGRGRMRFASLNLWRAAGQVVQLLAAL